MVNDTAPSAQDLENLRQQLSEAQQAIVTLTANQNRPNTEQQPNVGAPTINANYRVPKIAVFSREDLSTWFLQAEITLRNAGITVSSTKADFIAEKLDMEALQIVSGLLSAEPRADNVYELVKKKLIDAYSASDEARLRRMIKGQVPTTGKPSLIISRLKALGTSAGDDVIRSVFLDQLPAPCRAALAVSEVVDLEKLGKMADKYAESAESGPGYISAVGDGAKTPPPDDLAKKIADLTAEVAKLQASVNRGNRGRSRSQRRSDQDWSSLRPGSVERAGWCRLHTKYGADARHCCEKSCTFNKM